MPVYSYRCVNDHQFTRFFSLANHQAVIQCECGVVAQQQITAPVLVKCAADVRYDSPITGEHITSHHARIEDLKRHDCIEYDPEMKRDYERRIADEDAQLDKSIDEHVEASIEKMPTAKRAQLWSELTEQGLTAETVRSTPTA